MPERRLRSALLLVLAGTLGCQSPPSLGASCTHAADCAPPLVCGAGRCRSACTETRDCPTATECVPVEGGAVCSLAQDRCAADADCTAPLVCGGDGTCRAACLSDADCTSDGRCVLAGRLVCVASEPHGSPACTGATNTSFAEGTAGWCVETSAGVDAALAVTPVAEGYDGHALDLALDENAPLGSWVRVYQEVPLDGRSSTVFMRTRASVEGGTTSLAIELLDDHGFVLGRVARAVAGDGDSACDETGHPTRSCFVEPFSANVTMIPSLASWVDFANVDLRRVAAVRRVAELARTGPGAVEVVFDDVGVYAMPCQLGWWRQQPHLASFDLDEPTLPPSGWSFADAPLRSFVIPRCGQALALDGSQSLDWTGALPPAYTASLAWHGTLSHSPIDGVTFVRELGGDLQVSVVSGQIVMTACGARVADSALIVEGDARFQELQVSIDRVAHRACLARSGRLVGCADTTTCSGGAPTGLRFAETAAPLGDFMAIDEVRVDDGVTLPDGSHAASRSCHLDLACMEYGSFRLRDAGSGACVDPGACDSVWLCPQAAAATPPDPTLCGATGATTCAVDPSCPLGARPCDGSPCESLRLERCAQPLATSCS